MVRKAVFLFVSFILAGSLCGCVSLRKKDSLAIQGLKNQIAVLEAENKAKEDENIRLRESLTMAEEKAASVNISPKLSGEVKSRPKTKDIQVALKNAGYNPGPIDGKIGKQTRDAIRAFQRNNNLTVDGKVGKQTWELLKEFLYKKVK